MKLDSEKQEVDKLQSNLKDKSKEAAASQKKYDDANSSWKLCVTELVRI